MIGIQSENSRKFSSDSFLENANLYLVSRLMIGVKAKISRFSSIQSIIYHFEKYIMVFAFIQGQDQVSLPFAFLTVMTVRVWTT